jgi:hypothetical protein
MPMDSLCFRFRLETCSPQPGRCSTLTIVIVIVVIIIIIINHHPYLHMGSKFATPYEQYLNWGNNINFIFIAT